MAQDANLQDEHENAVVDRFPEGNTLERPFERDMSLEERLEHFEYAEIELARAEAALSEGVNKVDIYGGFEDIKQAIDILKNTATQHADAIQEPELARALSDKSITDGLAQAVKDRRTPDPDRSEAYRKIAESFENDPEPGPNPPIDREPDRER